MEAAVRSSRGTPSDEGDGSRLCALLWSPAPSTTVYHPVEAGRTGREHGPSWKITPVAIIANRGLPAGAWERATNDAGVLAAGVLVEPLGFPPDAAGAGLGVRGVDDAELPGLCDALKAFHSWALQRGIHPVLPGDFVASRETRSGIAFMVEEKDGLGRCRVRFGPESEWVTVSPAFFATVRRLLVLCRWRIHRTCRWAAVKAGRKHQTG